MLTIFCYLGYSAWIAEYNYNHELKKIFMACNLVSGMLQRLDKLHKNAFGSMCVFGKDGNIQIGGLWIFRGQQLAFSVRLFVLLVFSCF